MRLALGLMLMVEGLGSEVMGGELNGVTKESRRRYRLSCLVWNTGYSIQTFTLSRKVDLSRFHGRSIVFSTAPVDFPLLTSRLCACKKRS
jgi:hypothetical protein